MATNNFFSRDSYTRTFASYVKINQASSLRLSPQEVEKLNYHHKTTQKNLNQLIDNIDYESNEIVEKKTGHKIVISEEEQRDMLIDPFIVFSQPLKQRSVKDTPYIWYSLPPNQVRYSIKVLDHKLKESTFFEDPFKWLMMKGIIVPSVCSKCHYEPQKSIRNQDGHFVWDCCDQRKLIELKGHLNNKLIGMFPKLLYNWAIYGHIGTLENERGVMDTAYDSSLVRLFFELLRYLCQRTNELYMQKLGANGKIVQLLTFKFKKLTVAIAIELETDFVKFEILNEQNVSTIVSIFKEWFDSSIRLVIFEEKFEMLKEYFKDVKYDKDFKKKDTRFYKTFYNLLRTDFSIADYPDLLTSVLHEAVWRNRFGKTPYSTFFFITEIVSVQPKPSFKDQLNFIPFKYDVGISVDELYYGRFEVVQYMRPTKAELDEDFELKNVVRCPICKEPHTFISLFSHILNHYKDEDKSKYGGSIGLGSCQHCFRKNNILQTRIHGELLNDGKSTTKEVVHSCKICCLSLKNDLEYIKHLNTYHIYGDMPYGCNLCSFRSSFYWELIEHWKRNHHEVIRAYCRCCLKIFLNEDAGKDLFNHLAVHRKTKNKYMCGCCSLVFAYIEDFNTHFYRDHIIQNKNAFKYVVENYKSTKSNDVKVKLPQGRSPRVITKQRMDGTSIDIAVVKTARECAKIPRDGSIRENLAKKDYVLVRKSRPFCQECSQPIDVNHYSKKLLTCNKCKFKTYCFKASNHPCALHMSSTYVSQTGKLLV